MTDPDDLMAELNDIDVVRDTLVRHGVIQDVVPFITTEHSRPWEEANEVLYDGIQEKLEKALKASHLDGLKEAREAVEDLEVDMEAFREEVPFLKDEAFTLILERHKELLLKEIEKLKEDV